MSVILEIIGGLVLIYFLVLGIKHFIDKRGKR
jgi:hypothetical protein